MATESVTTGSTVTFYSSPTTLDGVTWDITGATVTLYMRKPDGTLLTKTAAVTDGDAGVAEYTTSTTDLDVGGPWELTWKVVLGGVTVLSPPQIQPVVKAP